MDIFKVLVLEDSSVIHKIYQNYFKYIKFDDVEIEYMISSSLEDVKLQCDIFRPDCMLVDLELDGVSMAGLKISEFFDPNKCSIISGFLNSKSISECNKTGFFTFIQKPFKFEILKSIIYSFYLKHKIINDIIIKDEDLRRKFQENMILTDELQDQYNLYDIILSTIPAIIYIKDKDLKYITCNNKFLEINGIKNINSVIGKTDIDIFGIENNYIIEDEKIISSGIEITDILNSSEYRSKFVWTLTSKYPFYHEGKISGIIAVIIDITNTIHLEHIIEKTFDAIKDGICIIDPDKKIIKTNKALNTWYSDQMPLVGKYCTDVFNEECDFCDDCPSKRQSVNCEIQYKKYWFEVKYYPIEQTGFTICYRRDITDRMLLEERTRITRMDIERKLTNDVQTTINKWIKTSSEQHNSLIESVNALESIKLEDKKLKSKIGV